MSTQPNLNELLLRAAGGRQPTESQLQAAGGGLTPEQEKRIQAYVDAGASYVEARDLILGNSSPAPDPIDAHAGAGTGNGPLPKKDFNDFILRATGRR